MINMDKKEQILHYYRIEGLSLREISRKVGLNRKTVTRYVREYEDVLAQLDAVMQSNMIKNGKTL